jgi:hypothetical protein
MPRGGQRKGTGRPTDKPFRERFQYRLDPETAKRFALWCRSLRVPLSTTLESLMKGWTNDHLEDVQIAHWALAGLHGEELLRWYKVHPVRASNLGQLALARLRRNLTAKSEKNRQTEMNQLSGPGGLVAVGDSSAP